MSISKMNYFVFSEMFKKTLTQSIDSYVIMSWTIAEIQGFGLGASPLCRQWCQSTESNSEHTSSAAENCSL